MSWWSDFTDGLKEGWDKATEAVSNAYNAAKETVNKAYTAAKETVSEVANKVVTEVKSFVADPKGYFKELACDVTMHWNANKNQIISMVVGAGALVLTTALATVTGGTAMFVKGTANATPEQILNAAKKIYADSPDLLEAAIITITGGKGE